MEVVSLMVDIRRICCLLDHDDAVCVTAQRIALMQHAEQQTICEIHIPSMVLSATCVYLAGKVKEQPRQLRDVVNVSFRINHPDSKPLQVSPLYEKIRENVVNAELLVLRGAGFYLSDYKPHAILLHMMHSLVSDGLIDDTVATDVVSLASALLNDVHMLTLLPINVNEEILASISLLCACEVLRTSVAQPGIQSKVVFQTLAGSQGTEFDDAHTQITNMYESSYLRQHLETDPGGAQVQSVSDHVVECLCETSSTAAFSK